MESLKYKTQPVTGSQENGSISNMPDVRVTLLPPANITFFLLNSTDAIIGWDPPEVYPVYDVNTTDIDPPFNETLWWLLNQTASVNGTSEKEATTEKPVFSNETVTAAPSVTQSQSDKGTTASPTKDQTVEEFCHPLSYFLNYTVNYNHTEEALGGLNDTMPPMIRFSDVFATRNVTVEALQNLSVEFSQGCVKEYLVFYFSKSNASTPDKEKVEHVNASDYPEVHLRSLAPDTSYVLKIAAVYVSGQMLNSSEVPFKTKQTTEKSKCTCDWHGAVPREDKSHDCSNNTEQPCSCRSGYQGMFCELCAPGYYRTAPYFPCHRCPCASHATKDMTCRFKEGFLTCSKCEPGYTGNICHMCDYGYYRYHKYCAPCNCNRNHDPKISHMCDVITGACFCGYNTTGMNCERCLDGYDGDPYRYMNCTLKATADAGLFKVLPQGVIAGICVGIILLICAVVGIVIYWRWNKNPTQRPFWTVELKDDHEGVNFNTVPNSLDDEIQVVDPRAAMEDQEFYEKQGGAAQSRGVGQSGKKYARLQEHV